MPTDPTQSHITFQWAYCSPLISCRFDPKQRYVFSSAEDNSIQRWSVPSGEKISFTAHDSWVFALEVTSDGETLLSGGGDGRLVWWLTSAEKPEPIRIVDAHHGWIRAVAISPDGKTVATVGNDKLVKLWNFADGSLLRTLTGHEDQIYSVLFHPQGQFLLSGDLLGFVFQWDLANGSLVRKFEAKDLHSYNGGQGVHFGGVRTMAMSPDGKFLACGGLYKAENPLGAVHEPLVMVFEWDSQKLAVSQIAEGLKGTLWRLLYHPDGYLIGACGGSTGGFLLFWKLDQPKDFHRLKLPHLTRDLDLSADKLQVATTHFDRHLRVTTLDAKKA
jgi:WD40 repeat protein